jgi:ribonuclease VapC
VILDTSALAAIVLREPGHENLIDRIIDADQPVGVPATVLTELGIVLSARLGIDARPLVGRLAEQLNLEILAFSTDHWQAAVGAFTRFSRGRHQAALNFGDCMSYAVAAMANEELLYVGDDFRHTDLGQAPHLSD